MLLSIQLDHDIHRASITPSVYLVVDVPDSVEKSFHRIQVHVTLSDSVFEQSSPFRHSATISKILQGRKLKFTDGGTDQCNMLEAVKVDCYCKVRPRTVLNQPRRKARYNN